MRRLYFDNQEKVVVADTAEMPEEVVSQRWLIPLYKGRLECPDGFSCITGKCGETVEFSLKFQEGRIDQAAFLTDGCSTITACGSAAAEMAMGKTPDEVLEITGDAIIEKLAGFLPKDDTHCAFLAAETLQEALHQYMLKKNDPEKKGMK